MRPGAKRSEVWNYFKKNEGENSTTCVLCKKNIQYYGGTSNLRQHLRRIHSIQMKQALANKKGNENEENLFIRESQTAASGGSSNNELLELNIDQPIVQNQEFFEYPQGQDKNDISNNQEEIIFTEDCLKNLVIIWTRQETLSLLYAYSLIKEKFKNFKSSCQWILISEELKKMGIQKAPESCERKWKNLLKLYQQHKHKGPGKFEFFNQLDNIVSSDPELRYIIASANVSKTHFPCEETVEEEQVVPKKIKCCCLKSEKQKRHEDRMALMTKKMEIEERKVKAFEDYLKFLKEMPTISNDS